MCIFYNCINPFIKILLSLITLAYVCRILSDGEKQPFIDEAEKLRNAHKKQHPHYKVCLHLHISLNFLLLHNWNIFRSGVIPYRKKIVETDVMREFSW